MNSTKISVNRGIGKRCALSKYMTDHLISDQASCWLKGQAIHDSLGKKKQYKIEYEMEFVHQCKSTSIDLFFYQVNSYYLIEISLVHILKWESVKFVFVWLALSSFIVFTTTKHGKERKIIRKLFDLYAIIWRLMEIEPNY